MGVCELGHLNLHKTDALGGRAIKDLQAVLDDLSKMTHRDAVCPGQLGNPLRLFGAVAHHNSAWLFAKENPCTRFGILARNGDGSAES